MAELPKKTVEFNEYAVDAFVVDSLPVYAQSLTLLRPLRLSVDHRIGVVYKDRVYPLVLNKDSLFTFILSGASYSIKDTRPIQLPVSYELQYFETPLKHISNDLSWNIERNQFGVYVYLSASDSAVESFVSILIEKYKLRVINWGAADDQSEFLWRVKLSSGLSVATVRAAVEELVSLESLEADVLSQNEDNRRDDRENEVSKLKNALNELKSNSDIRLDEKENELNLVYDELEKMIDENQQLSELNNQLLHDSQISVSSAQTVKRGAAEKLLSNVIFTTFPNLAFSPDVIDELKSRFMDSKSIWDILKRLNDGASFQLEKLNGLAGKVGWLELRKHINTGSDDRGRIYCRRSNKGHNYDVILHWKKNDKDQQKIFRKLASYEPFESTETIYM